MTTIITRSGKGSPLTHAELDANLTNLNADKLEPDANGRISAAGLIFPATPVPSTNVNTLDYYVEGTFTPTIEGLTTAGTGTYNVQSGRYTRVGNRVTVLIRVAITAHTGTGGMVIKGLPFTASVLSALAPLAIIPSNLTFSGMLVAYVAPNTTQINLATAATGAGLTALAMDTVCDITVSGTYEA